MIVAFSVTGMPAEKYEMLLRRLEAAGAGMPAGRLHHVSYGRREALQVIDIFETKESFEAFQATLLPILSELRVTARWQIHPTYRWLTPATLVEKRQREAYDRVEPLQ